MASENDDSASISELEHTENEDEHLDNEEEQPGEAYSSSKGKKKKKKKKKKKVTGEAAGAISSGEGASQERAIDKQESERRFKQALESAKQDDEMFLLLADANVYDAKARKLFDALKDNSSVTSINLSGNKIGDEGVQALVDVLQSGGCSELVALDLRGNSLSDKGQELLSDLRKKRKQLVIDVGPLPDESAAVEALKANSSSSSKQGSRGSAGRVAAGKSAGPAGQQQQQQQQEEQVESLSLRDLVKHSSMFRRYFQIDDEDAAGAGGSGSGEEEAADPLAQLPPPEELWQQVGELLPQGRAGIPGLGEVLMLVSRALDAEMAAMPAVEDKAQLDEFKPHFRGVLQHMDLLQQVMQLEPAPKVTQYSSTEAQPAVGSHRVWAAAILHMLLLHNNPIIDQAVHETNLLPTTTALALAHDRCGALQCRAADMLRSSLHSSVQQLWQGLFKQGYDCGAEQPTGGLVPPLHVAVMQAANNAAKQPIGKRPCLTGFAAEVAKTLLQSTDPSNKEFYYPALAAILDNSQEWQDSVNQQGAIHSILQEQAGQLCGPPPPRPATSVDEDEQSADQGLSVISGGQLMALLSRMGELQA